MALLQNNLLGIQRHVQDNDSLQMMESMLVLLLL